MINKVCIFLNLADIGVKKAANLFSMFNSSSDLLNLKDIDLHNISFLTDNDVKRLIKVRESGILDKELSLINNNKIDYLTFFDEDYPSLLREIEYPPLVLYIKGNRKTLKKFLFTIVGTRTPTAYGLSMARYFSDQLSLLGMVIVSGLAKGVDSAVHIKAIERGESIAVLGSGLFNIYPRENKELAEAIAKSGALISEFPLMSSPLRENFPRRNRIVSGLSKGVLVIEAALKSGALITAHLACEQNREVFSLPGNADSLLSKGTHSIIKEGAKLVDSLEDILDEFNINPKDIKSWSGLKLDGLEEEVYSIISNSEVITVDDISLKSGLSKLDIGKIISQLQLKGVVREVRLQGFASV